MPAQELRKFAMAKFAAEVFVSPNGQGCVPVACDVGERRFS